MAFSIKFLDEPDFTNEDSPGVKFARARIELGGGYSETFAVTLFEWPRSRYETSWRDELTRLSNGADRAVLFTQYLNPRTSGLPNWWALYRGEEGKVYIHEQMGIRESSFADYIPDEPSKSLNDRQTHTESGSLISEWTVSLTEIRTFLSAIYE